MLPLSKHDLLMAWDLGHARNPMDRALVLLCAAFPGTDSSSLAELSIGERDEKLLSLRELTFGTRLSALADCPHCGEHLELEVHTEQLRFSAPLDIASSINTGEYHVEFRLPNSMDLAAVRGETDVVAARRKLFEGCVTNNPQGIEMPETVVEAVAAAMAAADPQGDVRLGLNCPACGQHWEQIFDIASFLWSEVHAWALRSLREVHQLASAYGWSEADILAMSPWRRQVYLELQGG